MARKHPVDSEAPQTGMLSPGRIVKHSLSISGHRTSISLEEEFWIALRELASTRGVSLAVLAGEIDAGRGGANLSSAIRVYVLKAAQNKPQ